MLTFGHLATLANARIRNESKSPRHVILELAALVGLLASSFLKHAPIDQEFPDETTTTNTTTTTTTTTTAAAAAATMTTTTTSAVASPPRKQIITNTNTIKAPPTASPTKTLPTSPLALWRPPMEIRLLMGQIFFQLAVLALTCQLDLRTCIQAKLALNAKKYPVELCKGKANKYTAYSQQTGITKTQGQENSKIHIENGNNDNNNDNDNVDADDQTIPTGTTSTKPTVAQVILLTLDDHRRLEQDTTIVDTIQTTIAKFAQDRLWNRFHTPRNLVLALLGELGELAELYQWKREKETLTTMELEKVGQEIADVAIYLLRLATVCRVKIGEITLEACAKQLTGK